MVRCSRGVSLGGCRGPTPHRAAEKRKGVGGRVRGVERKLESGLEDAGVSWSKHAIGLEVDPFLVSSVSARMTYGH